MVAKLRAPGLYRGFAYLLLGVLFSAGVSIGIRAAYSYDPLVDSESILQIGMITAPLFFLVGIGAFDYWFYWASGNPRWRRPLRPRAKSWRDYFRVNTDHKVIGIQYIVTSFFFMFVGGLMAMLMRPNSPPWVASSSTPDTLQRLFDARTLMIFLFIIPVFAGIANYDAPADDRRAGHGVPPAERVVLLVAAIAGVMMVCSARARRLLRLGLDGLRPARSTPRSASPSSPSPCSSPGHRRSTALNFLVTIITMRAPG